jgi:RNA polymerase sigma-70 factor (ECF subfamily)
MQIATFGKWPIFAVPSPLPPPWPLGTGRDIFSARQARRGGRMSDERKGAMAPDPAQWIVAIAERRDRAAFAALFEFYAPRVKTMLMRMGVGAEMAEDIAQDTLLAVWGKAAQYDPARAAASAWIYAIARNLRIDRLRRDQRAKLFALYESVEPEEPQRPDGSFDAAESETRVRAALGELPEEQVRVVQLSFFEGRAHGDIAKLLDLPLGTVKSRLRLAMSRLRNLLGEPT